jgi:hypothetical protein
LTIHSALPPTSTLAAAVICTLPSITYLQPVPWLLL